MIDATSLDEKEQEKYRGKLNAETARYATGEPRKTNPSAKGEW